ncbi:MAG: radical SAM protein [Planctomycetes bacterium]|nr:radical SAM protein [Planctomycetota bacterium]
MSATTLAIQSPAPARSAVRPGRDSRLDPIVQKVHAGQRLSVDDGLLLYETPDIWSVGSLAHFVRRRMHGDAAYYNINRHLNYSNVCALSCTFCSFYRKKDQPGAYEFSIDRIRAEAIKAAKIGATEIHIVGGLHPWLEFEYYTEMMRAIREAAPKLHIKAFTAVEIVHLARISKRGSLKYEGIKSVLRDLKEAGLGSLPGGGAEVFDDRVHDEAFKGKIRAGTWLDVHRAAHELGLNTNATILYGHIEERADRIKHMEILRCEQDRTLRSWAQSQGIALQEDDAVVLTGPDEMYPRQRLPDPDSCESGYFQTIIPLPFIPDDSALQHLPGPTGLENLRTLAIARLMLDNLPHCKAFWIMHTLEMAQFMLQNGADDIDGTVVWYDITKVGGPSTHQEATVWDLQRAIREAGFRPVERDTLYRSIERDGDAWRVAQ